MRTRTLISTAAVLSAITTAKIIHDPTPSEFEELLTNNNNLFVAFSSLTLKSTSPFNNAFTTASETSSIPYTLINCDTQFDLCRDYEISSYPTIRLLSKPEDATDINSIQMTRYRGPRTPHALSSFILKHHLRPLAPLAASNFSAFKQIDDIVVIAFLRPDQDALLQTFSDVAHRHHGKYVFGYVTDSASADAEGVSVPSVVCYKNVDGDDKVASGHFGAGDVEALLEEVGRDVVRGYRAREGEAGEFEKRDKLTLYIFTSDDETSRQLRRQLTPLAKKYEQYVIFALVDINKYRDMARNFGVVVDEGEEEVQPAVVVHAPVNGNIFTHKRGKKIEVNGVEEMLVTILQGKARNGQVFGEQDEGGAGGGHDEL